MKRIILSILSVSMINLVSATDDDCERLLVTLDKKIADYEPIKMHNHQAGYGYSASFINPKDSKLAIRIFLFDFNKDKITDDDLNKEYKKAKDGVIRDFKNMPGFKVRDEVSKVYKMDQATDLVFKKSAFSYISRNDKVTSSFLLTKINNKLLKVVVTAEENVHSSKESRVQPLIKELYDNMTKTK
jgi:hypothetical protein